MPPEPVVDNRRVGSLRSHSMTVIMGLAFFGVSTYVYLTMAAKMLGPVIFGDFALFWGLTYGLGIGVCFPLEQEIGRRVAEVRTMEGPTAVAVLHAGYRLAALVLGPLAGIVWVMVEVGLQAPAGHKTALWGASVASLAALAVASVTRGGLAGQHRFATYSAHLLTEGAVRLVAVVALVYAGVTSPGPWMLVVAGALLTAVLVTVGGSRGAEAEQQPPWHRQTRPPLLDVARSVAALTVSAVLSQSLLNLGPAAINLLSPEPDGSAGRFLAASFVARLPVFAFAAVQVSLLPHLVVAAARKDIRAFGADLRQVLLAAGALGLAGVLVCAFAGQQLLAMIGPGYEIPQRDITLLAISVSLFVLTMVLQPAVVALRRAWDAAACWGFAVVVFIATCQLPLSPVLAVELALLAACGTALISLSLAVPRAVRSSERAAASLRTDRS